MYSYTLYTYKHNAQFITSEASYESSYFIIANNATYVNAMKISLKIYIYILSV